MMRNPITITNVLMDDTLHPVMVDDWVYQSIQIIMIIHGITVFIMGLLLTVMYTIIKAKACIFYWINFVKTDNGNYCTIIMAKSF
jgi:hypothetical protein